MSTVSPIPVKRRPRMTKQGHAYSDAKTKADEMNVGNAYDGDFYPTEPLALVVDVYQALPESKKKLVVQNFTIKPDVDNILKAVMDGLNGRAYADDQQVTIAIVRKHPRTLDIQGEYITYKLMTEGELLQKWNSLRQKD